MKKLLLQDEAKIARNLARQLTVYATGAPVRFSDRPSLEAILEQAHPSREFIARQMDLVESRREEVKAGTSALIPAGEAHAIVLESLQARP